MSATEEELITKVVTDKHITYQKVPVVKNTSGCVPVAGFLSEYGLMVTTSDGMVVVDVKTKKKLPNYRIFLFEQA